MHDLIILAVHVIATVMKLVRPGGVRAVVAESVLAKHQFLILNRSRRRAPNLRALDRLIAGFCSPWIKPGRLRSAAIALKPSTFLNFPSGIGSAKLPSAVFTQNKNEARPEGPTEDLIRAVIEMKQRNPSWGCPQI